MSFKSVASAIQENIIPTVENVLLMGFFTKQGQKIKSWKRRFFVIDKNYVLRYYKDAMAAQTTYHQPLGFFSLKQCNYYDCSKEINKLYALKVMPLGSEEIDKLMKKTTILNMDNASSVNKHLKAKRNVFIFCVESEKELADWIKLLKKASGKELLFDKTTTTLQKSSNNGVLTSTSESGTSLLDNFIEQVHTEKLSKLVFMASGDSVQTKLLHSLFNENDIKKYYFRLDDDVRKQYIVDWLRNDTQDKQLECTHEMLKYQLVNNMIKIRFILKPIQEYTSLLQCLNPYQIQLHTHTTNTCNKYHLCIVMGCFVLEWNPFVKGLIVPKRTGDMLLEQFEPILSFKYNLMDLIQYLSKYIVEWNTNHVYNCQENLLNNHYNCHTFIQNMLYGLNLKLQFKGALKHVMEQMEKKGYMDELEFVPDETFFNVLGGEVMDQQRRVVFTDHAQLDKFCYKVREKLVPFRIRFPNEYITLQMFDFVYHNEYRKWCAKKERVEKRRESKSIENDVEQQNKEKVTTENIEATQVEVTVVESDTEEEADATKEEEIPVLEDKYMPLERITIFDEDKQTSIERLGCFFEQNYSQDVQLGFV